MGASGGILACGAYLPRLRLDRAAIVAAIGWANREARARGTGRRAICNWDEDAITLGVEAARSCLAEAANESLACLSLASTTLPFADRDNAAVIVEALALPETTQTLTFTGSLRAGTAALVAAASRADGARTLVIAADARAARPGSPQELTLGHGAAAFVVGEGSPLASFLGVHHLTADFVDHYRMAGERFDYTLEERWVRDEGLLKLVPRAIAAALQSAGLQPADVHGLILPAPAGAARRIAQLAGLASARLQDPLERDCGDTGAAHPLLMLAAALEDAQPGQHFVLVGFGQGVDAIVVRGEDGLRNRSRRPVAEALATGIDETNYVRYLAHSGLLDVDFGMRAERDNRTAHTVAWRKHRQVAGFIGGRCRACGTVQYPRSRVCVNPACRETDTQDEHRLAESTGRVKSFTEDWQAYSPNPPYVYGNVEFAEGGNLLMEFADAAPGETHVGDAVRFVFRIKDFDRLRGFRRYFWKAIRI